MGKIGFNLKPISNYRNFINEQMGEDAANKRFEILEAIEKTEPGKLLQRILGVTPSGSTGKFTDFDQMFKPVKTGRVYIKGRYPGSPRIYYNNGKWCQESEASGHVYGQGCADTLEGILQFSVLRYIFSNLERGIKREEITQWINSNWDMLYKMSSVDEILLAYKQSTGMENMIVDPSVIPTLPNYKKYEKIFEFKWDKYSLSVEMNPFGIDDVKLGGIDKTKFPVGIKLSNKPKYAAKSTGQRWDVTIEIGTDSLETLDKKFLQGIRYAINKWYSLAEKRHGANEVNLEIAKQMTLSLIDGDNQADQHLFSYFMGLYKKNPIMFARALNALKTINPGMVNALKKELGETEVEDLRKGSSLLGRFGMD